MASIGDLLVIHLASTRWDGLVVCQVINVACFACAAAPLAGPAQLLQAAALRMPAVARARVSGHVNLYAPQKWCLNSASEGGGLAQGPGMYTQTLRGEEKCLVRVCDHDNSHREYSIPQVYILSKLHSIFSACVSAVDWISLSLLTNSLHSLGFQNGDMPLPAWPPSSPHIAGL